MSQPVGSYPWWSGEHRFAGTTRLLVGFVIGAFFTLLPTYYYFGRDAALRGGLADATSALPANGEKAGAEPPARSGSRPFASRMTYELSQLPQERAVVPAKPLPAAAPVAAAPVPAARAPVIADVPPSAPAPEPLPERVANARRISAVPPDPRDRTREIEKEAQKAEYREPARAAKAAPPLPAGKVIEGREVELKPRLETPTRPIVAGAAVDTRAEIEAERKRSNEVPAARDAGRKVAEALPVATTGPQVPGVTPIGRPAESGVGSVAAPAQPGATVPKPVRADSGPAIPASGDVQSRLEKTREWIAGAPPTTHTIQLMGTNSEEQLRGHLKSLSKMLEPDKLYIFRTMAQGKPSITVVYGAYADRQSAIQALEKLPAAVAANKPVLRTVNGIRAETKQHKKAGDGGKSDEVTK